jgi:hypothetical protein
MKPEDPRVAETVNQEEDDSLNPYLQDFVKKVARLRAVLEAEIEGLVQDFHARTGVRVSSVSFEHIMEMGSHLVVEHNALVELDFHNIKEQIDRR